MSVVRNHSVSADSAPGPGKHAGGGSAGCGFGGSVLLRVGLRTGPRSENMTWFS